MSNKAPTESKYWHYRTNDLSESHFTKLSQISCQWIYIGPIEVGEEAKGEHFHVAIKFYKSIREGSAIKALCSTTENSKNRNASWYISPKYSDSSILRFIKYICKDNINNIRFGELEFITYLENEETKDAAKAAAAIADKEAAKKLKEEKNKLKTAAKDELIRLRTEHAALGDIDWFRENDAKYMTSADFSRLLVWAQPDYTKKLDKLDNYFIHGEPGTGKSSSVDFLYPDCYRKIKNNEKWDSYYTLREGHKTVYFDEMDSVDEFDLCMGGYTGIKTCTDVYPFAVRQNYGNRQLMVNPDRFIITSNFTPSHIFSTLNKYGRMPQNLDMMLATFARRFHIMHVSEWMEHMNLYFDKTLMRTRVRPTPRAEICQCGCCVRERTPRQL
uniref:Replication-associated protein n=1 Tax=Turdus naumanni CRESS-DNA-virus sp. TaxID=2815063 RepID=A0A8A4XBJ3_9VIRU|nr:MAG: putative replication protein [Turdus naumanni CRESS-DNA-virus sp.]